MTDEEKIAKIKEIQKNFLEEVKRIEKERDDKIKAIVLRVDSPGGNALTSDLIWREIENTKKVEVEADFVTQGRSDSFLEQVVSRISLETGVSAVSWSLIEEVYSETL